MLFAKQFRQFAERVIARIAHTAQDAKSLSVLPHLQLPVFVYDFRKERKAAFFSQQSVKIFQMFVICEVRQLHALCRCAFHDFVGEGVRL